MIQMHLLYISFVLFVDTFHSCTCGNLDLVLQPEGKDMKEIVHDFALSQENGALDSRCGALAVLRAA